MDPVESFAERIRTTLVLSFFSTVFVIIGQAFQPIYQSQNAGGQNGEFSFWLLFVLFESLPGLITVAGIILATIIGGPLGFFGAILETIGANQLLFQGNVDGFWMVAFGALLVVIGSFVPWLKILSNYQDNRR